MSPALAHLGSVDAQCPPVKRGTIQRFHGLLTCFPDAEGDKGESAGAARCPILGTVNIEDRFVFRERFSEFLSPMIGMNFQVGDPDLILPEAKL